MNKISMRRAQPSDVPALMDLLRQVNEVHFRGRPDLFRRAAKYGADDVSATMSDDDRPIFVATDGSRVLAHIFCQVRDYRPNPLLQDIKTLYIDDVCVSDTTRGMGIGRIAMDWIFDWARNEGFYNVTLGVWECNPGARAFYEAVGMQVQETVMEKILQ